MDAKTVTALKQSIAHWKRMRAYARGFKTETPSAEYCALCKLFDCSECPLGTCGGTTTKDDGWQASIWQDAHQKYDACMVYAEMFARSATKMIRKLESKLPRKAKKKGK